MSINLFFNGLALSILAVLVKTYNHAKISVSMTPLNGLMPI
jgi:hypothetical protein